MAAVDVNRIAHRLERVETDPKRQRDSERHVQSKRRQSQPTDECVVAVHAKIEILEEAEERQVATHRYDQRDARAPGWPAMHDARVKPLAFLPDRTSGNVIDEGRGQEQDDEQRVRPAVKHVAEDCQNQVLRASWGGVVEHERERKEIEEEEIRAENHPCRYYRFVWLPPLGGSPTAGDSCG